MLTTLKAIPILCDTSAIVRPKTWIIEVKNNKSKFSCYEDYSHNISITMLAYSHENRLYVIPPTIHVHEACMYTNVTHVDAWHTHDFYRIHLKHTCTYTVMNTIRYCACMHLITMVYGIYNHVHVGLLLYIVCL